MGVGRREGGREGRCEMNEESDRDECGRARGKNTWRKNRPLPLCQLRRAHGLWIAQVQALKLGQDPRLDVGTSNNLGSDPGRGRKEGTEKGGRKTRRSAGKNDLRGEEILNGNIKAYIYRKEPEGDIGIGRTDDRI